MELKQQEYTLKILGRLQTLFEGSEDGIAITELEDNGNAADFFHALANLAPAVVYNKLTQREIGTLDFNHIANRLCFQNVRVLDKTEVGSPVSDAQANASEVEGPVSEEKQQAKNTIN